MTAKPGKHYGQNGPIKHLQNLQSLENWTLPDWQVLAKKDFVELKISWTFWSVRVQVPPLAPG
ncbi:hypothetical protein MTHERMOG20_10010 [Moorella thermoacetica]|nr:hypothetical protein MTHERMOG20_10010 [Moorella thermoacetica]